VIHELEEQLNPPLNLELEVIGYHGVLAGSFFYIATELFPHHSQYLMLDSAWCWLGALGFDVMD
jgi:hypothetical protein